MRNSIALLIRVDESSVATLELRHGQRVDVAALVLVLTRRAIDDEIASPTRLEAKAVALEFALGANRRRTRELVGAVGALRLAVASQHGRRTKPVRFATRFRQRSLHREKESI